ncbi:TolB family protein [Calditrichota bacterium]
MKKILLFIIINFLFSCKTSTESIEIFNSKGIYYSLNGEIFKLDYDGLNKTQLTFSEYDNNNPTISSNGNFLLFETQGLKDITASGGLMYDFSIINIMNLQNRKIKRVSDDTEKDWFPQFSPNNNEIAFSSTRTDKCDIYITDINENKIEQLTNNNFWNVNPKFSPDGSKILYESHEGGNYNIFIMDSDGSNQRQLTDSDWNINPQFSPKGDKIIWESYWDIYSMHLDGNNKINLSNNENIFARTPSYSHDADQIVFITEKTYNVPIESSIREIHLIDLNSNVRKTILKTGANFEPKFFPNDYKIIFTQYENSQFYICTINTDGSGYLRLGRGGNPSVF